MRGTRGQPAAPEAAVAQREALRRVPWLAPLGEAAQEQLARDAALVVFPAGAILVAELEAGEALFILLSGTAVVTVADPADARPLGTLAPGEVVGEEAFLTGAPRAATVTAEQEVTALRIDYPILESLIECFPALAAGLLERLAARLTQTEAALHGLLQRAPVLPATPGSAMSVPAMAGPATEGSAMAGPATEGSATPVPATAHSRRSLAGVLQEALATRQRDPAFLALTAFVLTLVLVRAGVALAERTGAALLPVLRAAYLSGILLVIVSTGLLLFRFRPGSRRLAALGYGAGFALIFNELSVFLAFDIFWSDMTHRDSSVVFDPVQLYARAEGHYAVGIALGVLIQLTYLRTFYRRAFVAIRGRLRRLVTTKGQAER